MQAPTPQDKLAEFDARSSRIEGIVEPMDARLNSLEQGQRNILSWIRWLLGIQITSLITLGTLISIELG